ncbi:MAG: tetratricopeptide repeat protein [Sedimentisphaerales bacterium]
MAETVTTDNNGDLSKAAPFFSRAEEVAATDNFDYAIDLYIEGLKRAPDAVEQGHKPLRYNAMVRQGKGGKKPSMLDKMKHSRGKTPLENMLNAEFLLARDPENLNYAEQLLNTALAGGFKKTALWIADLIYEANRASEKPSLQTFLSLKNAYTSMEEYAKAVNACGHACKLKPEDGVLAGELKDLSAKLTMQKGKYDQQGDFRDSIDDRETQEKYQSQQAVIKSIDFRQQAVIDARQIYQADKTSLNILKLASALSDLQNDQTDEEAIKLLEEAYKESRDFTFQKKAGEIKLRMLRRHARKSRASLGTDRSNQQETLDAATKELLAAELEHYKLCSENYPTELRFKYEYGVRLMRNQRYDEAIPVLQDARKDHRHKIAAMNKIGLCFFVKGWFHDAIDILKEAIDAYEIKDNDIAKDLRYNLARSYEQDGRTEDALELYRRLAQIDFSYKDVRMKVDKLRKVQ